LKCIPVDQCTEGIVKVMVLLLGTLGSNRRAASLAFFLTTLLLILSVELLELEVA
jgi:hypothetical protein